MDFINEVFKHLLSHFEVTHHAVHQQRCLVDEAVGLGGAATVLTARRLNAWTPAAAWFYTCVSVAISITNRVSWLDDASHTVKLAIGAA